MNENVKTLVAELKERQMLDKLHKRNTKNMNDYFKYSGQVEEEIKLKDFKRNKIPLISQEDTNDKIVKFYYKNSNLSLTKIAKKMGLSYGIIKLRLDKHFKDKRDGS